MVQLPDTEWRPGNGIGEYSSDGVFNIVDIFGNFIVDTFGNFVVDTGVIFDNLPATEWVMSEGE
jgi:hypothetical protein